MTFHRTVVGVLALAAYAPLARAGEQKPPQSAPVAVVPGSELPQYFPCVAWNAGAKAWLAVWEEGLPTGDETAHDGRAQDIYAVRVSADGKVLDPKGIPICTAKDFQCRPVVASDGKDFLVAWHDLRSGKAWDVYAARVSGEGKVLDADGFLVAGGGENQCLPDLVFGGGSYYAAWLDMRHYPEYRVYGARISSAGKVLDASGIELIRTVTDDDLEKWRKASFAAGKKGQGWHNHASYPGAPSLATNGKVHVVTSWTVVFGQGRHGTKKEVYQLRRVDAATGRPAAGQEPYAVTKAAGKAGWARSLGHQKIRLQHAAVWDKGFLTVGYLDFRGFNSNGTGVRVASFLGPDGAPGGAMPKVRLIVPEPVQVGLGYRSRGICPTTLGVAWDGKRALHVADRYIQQAPRGTGQKGDYDVIGIFINKEGKRISNLASGATVEPDKDVKSTGSVPPFMIASGESVQAAPAVAAGPVGSFLVVWQEEALGKDSRVMARLVRAK